MSCRSNQGSSAMTSYARATSGLSDVQTLHLFHRMLNEGREREAETPTPQAVSNWRRDTIIAVRGNSNISEGQKERIVQRLEALPADFVPDGPTFHAWNRLRSSAWHARQTLNKVYQQLAERGGVEAAYLAARAETYQRTGDAARWRPPAHFMERIGREFPDQIDLRLIPQDNRTLYALSRLLEENPASLQVATTPNSQATPADRATAIRVEEWPGQNSVQPEVVPASTSRPEGETPTQAEVAAPAQTTRCPSCGQFLGEGSHACPEAVIVPASTPTPPPSAAPTPTPTPTQPASTPRVIRRRWVRAAHEVRQNLTDQEQAQLRAAQEAQAQEAARPRQEAALTPKLSGPEGQATYDNWVTELKAARVAGSGPPYETEAVLGEAATSFGVELEFKGADADAVARKLYEMGIAGHPQMVSYHHSCPECQGKWKVERDGSVTNNRSGRNIGGEVVAPVLRDTPEHWQQLKQVADTIKELGGQCDNDTGQHVHISTASYDNQGSKYRNLALEVAAQEDLLYRLSAPDQEHHRGLLRTDRPEYHYAQPIAPRLQQFLTKPNPALRTLLKAMRVYEIAHDRVPWAHYMSLNMQHVNEAEAGKSRVEFRTFNGTLDPVQIQNNVRLAAGLVHTAGQNEVSLPEGRGLGWHRQAHTDEEDSEQIRGLIDRLHLSESGAKAVLDTFLRGRWQYQNRAALQQAS